MGVKDLYRVDGLSTRAGSELPAELFAGPQSTVVTALRAAGARIIGKTAMDEFAYCEPPPTMNPRDPRRTPGGSSGGSAAAVAAGMCPIAVGSQTLQSIIVPAAYCGVVGYKPTYERIPYDGIALSPSIDTVGFCADSIKTIQKVMRAIVPDWRTAPPGRPVLGVPPRWGVADRHDEGWDAFDRHLLSLQGFERPSVQLPWNDRRDYWKTIIGDLLHGEMARVHEPWFDTYENLYRPRTRAGVIRGRGVRAERIAECRQAKAILLDELSRAGDGIDVWICPATGWVAPLGYQQTGDSWLTSFWSYAGCPAITIPIFDGEGGMPHGLQCVARPGADEELLGWGAVVAAAFDANG